MVASSQEAPPEWKRTPNSTQASDCYVLAKIWATRDLLSATACPAVLHVKGHQDKKTACELLPLPAQLNVDANKLAGDHMAAHCNNNCVVVPMLPTSGRSAIASPSWDHHLQHEERTQHGQDH